MSQHQLHSAKMEENGYPKAVISYCDIPYCLNNRKSQDIPGYLFLNIFNHIRQDDFIIQ